MGNTQITADKVRQFQITSDEGDIYEATRQPGTSEWLITFPTGDRRFDGTKSEAIAFIKQLISGVANAA
jgi:hypothetical protein